VKDELPQGWATVQLGEIAQINPRHPKDLDDSISVSFAPMAALSESKPQFQFLEERPLSEVRKGFTHFAEGDVLFAKITPCMENGKGAVAIGLRNGLGCGTTELHVIRPLGEIESHYIYRFLAQPSVRRAAKDNFTGTAGQARVPTSFIEQLEVPIAPLTEQRRIVAKLEGLLGKVDACKERLAKIPALLKRFRQSVLAAACSGRLTADWREENQEAETAAVLLKKFSGNAEISEPNDLPARWIRCRLESLADLITKGASPRWQGISYTDAGVLFVTSENVGWGKMLFDQRKFVEPRINEIQPRSVLQKGDLLTNIVGASIGRSAIYELDEIANTNQAVALIRLKACLEKRYILHVLNSPSLVEHMHCQEVDVARSNVSLSDVREFPIPLPPLAEQHEIVRRVEKLFALADQIEARLARAQSQTDAITPSLLALAFRGQLVPQHPNDEPASALMDRIRQAEDVAGKLSRKASARRPA